MARKNPFFDFYHNVVEIIIDAIFIMLVIVELFYLFTYFVLIGYITGDTTGSGSNEYLSVARTIIYMRSAILIFALLSTVVYAMDGDQQEVAALQAEHA